MTREYFLTYVSQSKYVLHWINQWGIKKCLAWHLLLAFKSKFLCLILLVLIHNMYKQTTISNLSNIILTMTTSKFSWLRSRQLSSIRWEWSKHNGVKGFLKLHYISQTYYISGYSTKFVQELNFGSSHFTTFEHNFTQTNCVK